MILLGGNVSFDNFEIKGFFWDGTNIGPFGQITLSNWGQNNGQEFSNNYIHGWSHPGTDHTSTAGIACVFCTGGGGTSSADNNVIDGSDVATDHSMNAFFDGPPKGAFNFIKQVSSGFIVSFDSSYHDNHIEDVGPAYCNKPFPAFAGACSHENAFEDNADTGLSFYNNTINGVHAGLALWFAPYPSATANVWNNVVWGVDDNQVLDIAPPVYVPANCPQGATGNNYCLAAGTYNLYNNTIQCGNDTTQYDVCNNNIGIVGSGSVATAVLFKNNHIVSLNTTRACASVGSGGATSCSIDTSNIVMTEATATTQNYTSAQSPYVFFPTTGGSTIGAGTNLTTTATGALSSLANDTTYACMNVSNVATCPARTVNARPSGATAWDAGAYMFSSGSVAGTPTCSPAGGTFSVTQNPTCSVAGGAPVICYTTNGTTPVTNGAAACTTGTLYSGAITISATTTLKLIAGGTSFTDGPVQTYTYIINPVTTAPAAATFAMGFSQKKGIVIAK